MIGEWIALLQSTLKNAGFNNIWSREMDGFSSKYIKQALKLRLDDMFKQEWHDKMFNNNQCTNYRMFKGEPIMEDYLLRLDNVDRINLSRFCCRNHSLPVTRDRLTDNRQGLMCPMCDLDEVGDEFHYLFRCAYFSTDREKLLGKKCVKDANVHFMSSVFNCKKMSKLKTLARFVNTVMHHFRNLYNVSQPEQSDVTTTSRTRSGRTIICPTTLNL